MGCHESKQKSGSTSDPLLSDYTPNDDTYISMSSRMGQPPAQVPAGSVQLASQHERLILELLPFKDIRQFHE